MLRWVDRGKLYNVSSSQLFQMNLTQFNLTNHDIDLTLTCITR